MSKDELPIFNPLTPPVVVETVKMAGVPVAVRLACGPRCEERHCACGRAVPRLVTPTEWTCECGRPAETPQAVLTALETRAKLLAAEQACEEIGRLLSEQIRAFSADELLAYGEATSGKASGDATAG